MKLLKKALLTLIIVIGFTIGANAQSGWQTGNWYQYRGQTWTEWKDVHVGYNQWGNPIYQRQCRRIMWRSETRNGYVYVWGQNGWYTQSYQGTMWRCYWGNWYVC